MDIGDEIFQTRWSSFRHKALVNISFTCRILESASEAALKEHGLSQAQFNILRILRGQKGKPATVKLLTERMLDKSSNASRLVDRLVEKGLVHRVACPDDRRAVEITLTEEGLALLKRANRSIDRLTTPSEGFDEREAAQLSDLLDRFRDSFRATCAEAELDHDKQGEPT